MNAAKSAEPRSDHPDRHEQLLQSAIAGELPREDAGWSVLRDCAACSRRLEQLDELQRVLDDAGRDQSDVLRAATSSGAHSAAHSGSQAERAPGAALVAPFVRAKLAEERRSGSTLTSRTTPVFSFRAWAAAAAAAALVVGWFARQWSARSDADTQGSRRVLLGDQRSRNVHPDGPVSNYLPFEWDIALPPGGSFTLTVWDAALDDPEQPLSRMPKIKEQTAWISADIVSSWPMEIGWQVEARDATGAVVGSPHRAYAKLKRP